MDSQLRAEAARQGLDAYAYVMKTLREALNPPAIGFCVSQSESELLMEINAGLPEETWRRYSELIEKRRAETLTPDEQQTLIEICDQIERQNGRRVERLVQLARLRGVTLAQLADQLGMEAPAYE